MARILVVDDDPQFRRLIRVVLTATGYEVTEAANGLQALTELRAKAVDLILLDWRMPGMDGEATCQAIRRAGNLPIIVVTASDRVQEAFAAGADAFLRKPVDSDALLARISAALE